MPFPLSGSQFNIAQFEKAPRHFGSTVLRCYQVFQSSNSRAKKGPRGFRRRSKSGRKRPGRAATAGGWGSYRVAYFANQTVPRIDEAQFLLTFLFFLTGGRLDRANPPTPQRMTSVKASTIRLI